jgi:predicted dehydrogenase
VEVSAMTETFVKERVHAQTGKKQKVTIDDACAFLAKFANGSLAIFESTRYARGHKALYTFEINGADGSLAWDLHDLHRLAYYDYDKIPRLVVGDQYMYLITVASIPTWISGGYLV